MFLYVKFHTSKLKVGLSRWWIVTLSLLLVIVASSQPVSPSKCIITFLSSAALQNSSKARLRYLDQLHAFVTAATKELMWLNEKEEEEVNYDWSERNTNMAAKKENYSVG